MKIVLIGYRGTGKSMVGHAVAKRVGMTYIGMDESIVASVGMSIPEFVKIHGWTKFRDTESVLAKELAAKDHIVVDTGGGVIERPENMQALRKNACVIWLKASVDVIVARIQDDTQRPALVEGKTFTEEVAEVLSGRLSKYEAAAHYSIDTDHLSPNEIADEIVTLWETHGKTVAPPVNTNEEV